MINWKNFLTGKDDATISNVTVLSRPAEWHSIMSGLLIGITGEKIAVLALVGYILGRETRLLALVEHLPEGLHKNDTKKEPAYAATGMLIGMAIHSLMWGVPSFVPYP